MPNYSWLLDDDIDYDFTERKIKAMQRLGVPYSKEEKKNAVANAKAQAKLIGDDLANQGVKGMESKEVVALIAYLQRIGTDIK